MRPKLIKLCGINSFTDLQVLDFERISADNLFCITGATGAGKTTIFDCIMLALYGKGFSRTIGSHINSYTDKAEVWFSFEFDNDYYEIYRCLKRSGANLARLNKNGQLLSGTINEVNKIIVETIGLESSEFTSIIMLQQGEFSKFIKDTPQEQIKTVGRIFNLNRFLDIAKKVREKKKYYLGQLENTAKFLKDSEHYSQENIQQMSQRESGLLTELKQLESDLGNAKSALEGQRAMQTAFKLYQNAVKDFNVLKEQIKALNGELDAVLDKIAQLDAKKSGISDLKNKLGSLENKLAVLEILKQTYSEKQAAVLKMNNIKSDILNLEDKLGKNQKECGDLDNECKKIDSNIQKILSEINQKFQLSEPYQKSVLKALEHLKALGAQYENLEDNLKKTDKQIKELTLQSGTSHELWTKTSQENNTLKQAVQESNLRVRQLKSQIEHAMLANSAAALASSLHEGDLCPVCGGVFKGAVCHDSDIESLKSVAAAADYDYEQLKLKSQQLTQSLDRQSVFLENDLKTLNQLEKTRSELLSQINENQPQFLLLQYKPMLENLLEYYTNRQDLKNRHEKMLIQSNALKDNYNVLNEQLLSLQETIASADKRLGEYKDNDMAFINGDLTAQAQQLKAQILQYENDYAKILHSRLEIESSLKILQPQFEQLQQKIKDKPEFDQQAFEVLVEQCSEYEKRQLSLTKELTICTQELKVIKQNQLARAKYEAQAKHLQKQADLLTRLEELVKDSKLLNYAALEYIKDFTFLAGTLLSKMTNGQYSLEYLNDKENGGFYVNDYLREGKTRKADSLSGGETFLASLAIAIAVSKTLAKQKSFGMFLLDEGFGTLDLDLIETVYSALETLSRDCLVGVITHSSELVALMPSVVEIVHATADKGSVIKV